MTPKYKSTTHYLLAALIPYSEANLKLVFVPRAFFADLAKLDNIKQATLRSAYGRAIQQGLIEIDDHGVPRLTSKGQRKVRPYRSRKLKDAKLMVIFDIPEVDRWKRRQLRALLRELSFKQEQKSVWTTVLDHREYLKSEVAELGLEKSVRIFECRPL